MKSPAQQNPSTDTPAISPRRLVDLHQIRTQIPNCKDWFEKALREQRFPQPIVPGKKRLWLQSDIDAWLDAQIAARDAKLAGKVTA